MKYVALAALLITTPVNAASTYMVGNSFSYDSLGSRRTGITGLEAIATANGYVATVGYHLQGGQNLTGLWTDPNSVEDEQPSRWPTALQSGWDFLTLQPHQSFGSKLGMDLDRIDDFLSYGPRRTGTFVLETWPILDLWPYQSAWLDASTDSPTAPTEKCREYFDHLMTHTRANHPGKALWMIPTGEVFFELAQRIDSGEITGVTLEDFWRDGAHLDRTMGRYVAATTAFSTIYRKDPRGLTLPVGYFDTDADLTSDLTAALQDVVWSVVSNSLWTGLADFNWDGSVDGDDLTLWEAGTGDANGDGDSSGEDFLIWQREYTGDFSTIVVLPEPTMPGLAAVAAGCFLRGRRFVLLLRTRSWSHERVDPLE